MKQLRILLLGSFLFSSTVFANINGTEYQNFNPSITGLDFTTVHSSETLRPCFCNLGVFTNYAKNTLTYSDQYYQTNTDLKGQRVKDYMIGGDIVMAMGLSDRWDFGVALPFIITAKNEDPYGVTYFDKFGLMEVRPMTKFRFLGDRDGGLAAVFSMNFNTIDNNPFSGETPGATLNLELVADTTLASTGTKLAANLGYRKRNPGKQITDPVTGSPAPFVPFTDSIIFSVAAAQNFSAIKSDLILEILGSKTGKLNEDDSVKKNQQALEANLGLRHDWSQVFNIHAGIGSKLADAQASPDLRAYLGVNYQFGPICSDKPAAVEKKPAPVVARPKDVMTMIPRAVVMKVPKGTSNQVDLNMPVTAEDPNNYQSYRWKLGATNETDCTVEKGYSSSTPGLRPIRTFVGPYPDGDITLCAVARGNDGTWQPFDEPTIYRWTKKVGYELFRLNASVLFDFDKDTLQKRSYGELDKIAKYLQAKPFKSVIVEGHTDSKGSDTYNLDLSKRRAQRVKMHLVETYEFDANDFSIKGIGEAQPVDTNDTDEGRANNRRVEFKIFR